MNGKEVKAAIERLRSQCDGSFGYSLNDVANAFPGESHGMGIASSSKLRDALIALLEQADPETHMELPVDANGEVIHIGDKVDPTKDLRDLTVMGVGTSIDSDSDMGVFVCYDDYGYTWYNAMFLRHNHRPTIEEVLYACCNEYHEAMLLGTCDIPCDVPSLSEVINKHAERLREAVRDDE